MNEVDVELERVRGWIDRVSSDGKGRLAETTRRMNDTFDPSWRAVVSPHEAWAMCCAVWHVQQGRLDSIRGTNRAEREERFIQLVAGGNACALFEEEMLTAVRAHFLHSRINEDNPERIFHMARAVAIVACQELGIKFAVETR